MRKNASYYRKGGVSGSMRIAILIISVLFGMISFVHSLRADPYTSPAHHRVLINIDDEWKFKQGDVVDGQDPALPDDDWEFVSLPHTWNAQDGADGGTYYRGPSWYRKRLWVSSELTDRSLFLRFEGANIVSDVYVNGNYAGTHRGGFAAFCFDVTPLLNFDQENVLAVKVNNAYDPNVAPLSGDFTFFGGIYRSVYLLATDYLAITPLDYASAGVFITPTNVTEASADVEVRVKLRNDNAFDKNATILTTIVDAQEEIVATMSSTQIIPSRTEEYEAVQNTSLAQPHLWKGREDPYLYNVYVEVQDETGLTVDAVSQPLGFRYFNVDVNNGFFLNGAPYHLHGVCRHQDWDAKGWAIGPEEHDKDFDLINEIGATTVRLAHYQHDQYVYDICDRSGLVVWAELALVNRITNSPAFFENAHQQLAELIRQNYNHPSIFIWSLSNEIRHDGFNPAATTLLAELNEQAHNEDPQRLTTHASDDDYDPINEFVDLVSFNKYYGWYTSSYSGFHSWIDARHSQYPHTPIGMSEYGAGASPFFHSKTPVKLDHTEEYQSLLHEAHWIVMKQHPYLWGTFVWNMFDFASDSRDEGDAPGKNDKGLVTRDRRIKKDAFYWYKANWSDEPFVYITSRRFSPRTDGLVEVKVYSNCDVVELMVNGQSQGIAEPVDRICRWPNVALNLGGNMIEALGIIGDEGYQDHCLWFYEPGGVNDAPTVSITSPAEGSVYWSPLAITINVDAQDSDGTVVWVDFYDGDTKIGEDSDEDDGWSFSWTGVPFGSHSVRATAMDNLGVVTTSDAVTIQVNRITKKFKYYHIEPCIEKWPCDP